MAAEPWTLNRIIDKVRDDLELHGEDFVTYEELVQFVNDAIDDAEEIVVDCFSDFLLWYKNHTVAAGDTYLPMPDDIYEGRIRGTFYKKDGFTNQDTISDGYKLRRIPLGEETQAVTGDPYRYRLVNSPTDGQQIFVWPPIADDDASSDKFRTWYIRQFKRLEEDDDVLEKGCRVQYVLSHVKVAVMQKEGNEMLEVEMQKLLKQEDKLKNSVSRLTDDDEGNLLEPDDYSLDEAYGVYGGY